MPKIDTPRIQCGAPSINVPSMSHSTQARPSASTAQRIKADIGHCAKDLRPVAAYVVASAKVPFGVGRGLIDELGRKTVGHYVEVMLVGCLYQARHNRWKRHAASVLASAPPSQAQSTRSPTRS